MRGEIEICFGIYFAIPFGKHIQGMSNVCFANLPHISFRPKLDAVADRTMHTPLIGLFGALLKDWIPLIDEYYYCTSASLNSCGLV